MTSQRYWTPGGRHDANEASRVIATNESQPWEDYEQQLLLEWDGTDGELSDLAAMLGRSIEACRQRYHFCRRAGRRVNVTRSSTTTTTTTTTSTYSHWPDDERSDWYV